MAFTHAHAVRSSYGRGTLPKLIEFKKFKKNQLINFSYLNSEDIMDCIPTAFDLVKYIILNNLSEMKSFYDQKKNIETMNFEFYGLSLF